MYANNSSFNLVKNTEFLKLIELLHLGYRPPSRREIASELLEHVDDQVYGACKKVKGRTFSMEIDGWSNQGS